MEHCALNWALGFFSHLEGFEAIAAELFIVGPWRCSAQGLGTTDCQLTSSRDGSLCPWGYPGLRGCLGQGWGFAQGRSQPVPLPLQKNISLTSDTPNGKTHRNVPWQEAGEAGGRQGLQALARGPEGVGWEQPSVPAHCQLSGTTAPGVALAPMPSPMGAVLPPQGAPSFKPTPSVWLQLLSW